MLVHCNIAYQDKERERLMFCYTWISCQVWKQKSAWGVWKSSLGGKGDQSKSILAMAEHLLVLRSGSGNSNVLLTVLIQLTFANKPSTCLSVRRQCGDICQKNKCTAFARNTMPKQLLKEMHQEGMRLLQCAYTYRTLFEMKSDLKLITISAVLNFHMIWRTVTSFIKKLGGNYITFEAFLYCIAKLTDCIHVLCIQQTRSDESINGEGISEEEERRIKLQAEVFLNRNTHSTKAWNKFSFPLVLCS